MKRIQSLVFICCLAQLPYVAALSLHLVVLSNKRLKIKSLLETHPQYNLDGIRRLPVVITD